MALCFIFISSFFLYDNISSDLNDTSQYVKAESASEAQDRYLSKKVFLKSLNLRSISSMVWAYSLSYISSYRHEPHSLILISFRGGRGA